MTENETLELEEIQDEIVSSEEEPNHEALTRWCRQYPKYQDALTTFFAAWAIQLSKTELPAVDEARVGSKMVSHALSLIHNRRPAAEESKSTAVEMRLYKMIKSSGVSEAAVMAQCQLDETLLAKLDRRLIELTSIPALLFQSLSDAIRFSIDEVKLALTGGPIPLTAYKSSGKPSLKQESFLEAVATSDLNEEAKKEWERVVSSDGSIGGLEK